MGTRPSGEQASQRSGPPATLTEATENCLRLRSPWLQQQCLVRSAEADASRAPREILPLTRFRPLLGM